MLFNNTCIEIPPSAVHADDASIITYMDKNMSTDEIVAYINGLPPEEKKRAENELNEKILAKFEERAKAQKFTRVFNDPAEYEEWFVSRYGEE